MPCVPLLCARSQAYLEHRDARMTTYHFLGVWKYGPVISVRFGEHRILDDLTVSRIADELYGVADRPDCQCLLLNFASVVQLSSVMLGKLLMLRRKMESKGGTIMLCDIGPEVQDVFETTKLAQIFDIYETEIDGVRAFGQATPPSPASAT